MINQTVKRDQKLSSEPCSMRFQKSEEASRKKIEAHKGIASRAKQLKRKKNFNGLLFEPTKVENGEANRLLARGERRWIANKHKYTLCRCEM